VVSVVVTLAPVPVVPAVVLVVVLEPEPVAVPALVAPVPIPEPDAVPVVVPAAVPLRVLDPALPGVGSAAPI
jgi:hypothetical protein